VSHLTTSLSKGSNQDYDMIDREDSYGNDPMQGKIMIQMSF
jgi:hypothetical protein